MARKEPTSLAEKRLYGLSGNQCANAEIEAANVSLKGNIDLGDAGGKGVARIGDEVEITGGSSAGKWPIISGSSKVKVI